MFSLKFLKDRVNFPLLIIILIAAVLRLAFLSSIPNGFHRDEAAAGYDAYSILKTLHTQYGQFLPLFSKTYEGPVDDYDESLYRFLIIPFIPIFGLNEFTTRLPAALVGTLNILTFYYFVKEFKTKKLALLSALFLALCPWHIQLSRIAFRSIFFPCSFCFALFLFFRGLKKPNYLIFSSVVFGFCLYTYTSARVFVPFFVIGLGWIYREKLLAHQRQVILSSFLFSLILFIFLPIWTSPELMKRTHEEICFRCLITNPFKLIEYTAYYLSYYFIGYLFFGVLNSRDTMKNVSAFYLIDLITISYGLIALQKENKKEKYFLLLWLFLYPIPSALTTGTDKVRSIIGVPVFSFLSAYGLTQLSTLFKGNQKRLFRSATISLMAVSFSIFLITYFVGYSIKPPIAYHYGMREAITYAEKSSYSCVMVSDKFRRPYTMILFYTQYPPSIYQRSPIEPAVRTNYSVGKYHIISIAKSPALNQNCLFMLRPKEMQKIAAKGYNWRDIYVVRKPTGEEAIKLIEVSKQG